LRIMRLNEGEEDCCRKQPKELLFHERGFL